jgi:hypothetical protein
MRRIMTRYVLRPHAQRDIDEVLALVAHGAQLRFFDVWGFRKRTPGPPPFSSMNSTPARVNAPSIVESVSGSPA